MARKKIRGRGVTEDRAKILVEAAHNSVGLDGGAGTRSELYMLLEEHRLWISLNMFACYGTLLGTVREHGSIAWDDVDVGLVGMDYVRFLDILSKEYGDKYIILNPYTKTWHSMNFTHITNTLSVSFEREHLKKWHGCPFMTGLDVYPYYYIPRNPDDEEYIMDVLP